METAGARSKMRLGAAGGIDWGAPMRWHSVWIVPIASLWLGYLAAVGIAVASGDVLWAPGTALRRDLVNVWTLLGGVGAALTMPVVMGCAWHRPIVRATLLVYGPSSVVAFVLGMTSPAISFPVVLVMVYVMSIAALFVLPRAANAGDHTP